MISEIKHIYDSLEDDESKDIFVKKLLFNITGDMECIFNITDMYLSELKRPFSWKQFIRIMKILSQNKKLVIYGGGGEGDAMCGILESQGVRVECFCDRNEKLQNTKTKRVITPKELFKRYFIEKDLVIIIATEMFYDEIYNFLIKNSISPNDIYGSAAQVEKQYFAEDIIKFSEDEVFVDGGSLNLDSSITLLKKCNTVKKIFAFEPDKINYGRCQNIIAERNLTNVQLINEGLYSKKDTLKFNLFENGSSHISDLGESQIDVVSLDEVLKDESITFIKMDIEGAEVEALIGASNLIKENKPKLAISIYHKPEHMIEIPKLIKMLVPEYKLYIRHYSIFPAETILYAVI